MRPSLRVDDFETEKKVILEEITKVAAKGVTEATLQLPRVFVSHSKDDARVGVCVNGVLDLWKQRGGGAGPRIVDVGTGYRLSEQLPTLPALDRKTVDRIELSWRPPSAWIVPSLTVSPAMRCLASMLSLMPSSSV